MVDIGEILARRRTQDSIEIILETTPQGKWRGLIRENGGQRATMNPGHPGFETPGEAAADADARLTALLESREQAQAANIEVFLEQGRIERRLFSTEEGDELRWAARREDGTWEEGHSRVRNAIRAAIKPRPIGEVQQGGAAPRGGTR